MKFLTLSSSFWARRGQDNYGQVGWKRKILLFTMLQRRLFFAMTTCSVPNVMALWNFVLETHLGTCSNPKRHQSSTCHFTHHYHHPRRYLPNYHTFSSLAILPSSRVQQEQQQRRCFRSTALEAVAIAQVDGMDIDTTKLPRLYVGPVRLIRIGSVTQGLQATLSVTASTSPSLPLLQPNMPVELTMDQSHYLQTVLRLGKKKKTFSTSAADSASYVRLFDGSGNEWLAKILPSDTVHPGLKNLRRRQQQQPLHAYCLQPLQLAVTPDSTTNPDSSRRQVPPRCWLVVAPTKKKERLRWMIEKCTELNVAGFLFLETEYSESFADSVSSSPNTATSTTMSTLSKLQAYAVEASEQCERDTVPSFVVLQQPQQQQKLHVSGNKSMEDDLITTSATTLQDLVDAWKVDNSSNDKGDKAIRLAICRERSNHNSISIVEYLDMIQKQRNEKKRSNDNANDGNENLEYNSRNDVVFVVGSEGGWSPAETALFDSLVASFPDKVHCVSLGSTILRSETACMLAVGAFSVHPYSCTDNDNDANANNN